MRHNYFRFWQRTDHGGELSVSRHDWPAMNSWRTVSRVCHKRWEAVETAHACQYLPTPGYAAGANKKLFEHICHFGASTATTKFRYVFGRARHSVRAVRI